MGTLFMLIGIQGSGKTTLSKRWGLPRVCPDEIRAELTGNAADQSNNTLAWTQATRSAISALREHGVVVLDATNTNSRRRQDFIYQVCADDTHRVAIVVWAPLTVCLERNRGRDRVVPEDVIRRYYDELLRDYPSLGFDFHEVFHVATA